MECSVKNWINKEFVNISFGDLRLEIRFKKVMEGFTKRIGKNISSAFDSWKQIKAGYRFLSNPKVQICKILSPHRNSTIERINEHKKVLLIQDTTYFDFNNRKKTKNLDLVGRGKKQEIKGLILHNTFALTTQGLPLGLVDQQFTNRKSFHSDNSKASRKLAYWKNPIEKKESFRWVQAIKKCHNLNLNAETIHMADREGDIYELYRDCADFNEKFLIRAKINRSINKEKRREPPQDKLFEHIEKQPTQGEYKVKIQINGVKKYRIAKLSIHFTKLSISAPPTRTVNKDGDNLKNVEMYGIMAIEKNPPKNYEGIKWVLLTNIVVENLADAIEKVIWYSYRWNIEVFHKILKSGYNVEKAQIQNGENLKKFIVMKSIIAWRIFWLTRTFDQNKELNCEMVITKEEWKILYYKFNKSTIPKVPPTVKEVYYWIARLGGFINRNTDPKPGIISIWRGWNRFMDLIEDYDALKFMQTTM